MRANLTGAARNWFYGRVFYNWEEFQKLFRATFVCELRMSDKWNALQCRCQSKDEHVMDYYQSKVKLCRDLKMPFNEVRDHVIQGLYAKDLAMFALSRQHTNETELLRDLIEWSWMNNLRGEMVKNNRKLEISVQPSKVIRYQNQDKSKNYVIPQMRVAENDCSGTRQIE